MSFHMLIGATGICQLENHMSFLPEVRKIPSGGNLVSKFPRNADFYVTTRNPSIVQLELISRYMECL